MFPRTLKCFGSHLGGLYERFAFFGDKNINFGFSRFPFSFHAGVPPRKKKKKTPGLFLRASVDLCSVIIVLVVRSFSLLADK